MVHYSVHQEAHRSAGGIQQHEVYEDLGINSYTTVDESFNIANFACTTLENNDPERLRAFECSLAGSTRINSHARQLSSEYQSPLMSGLTTSSSASPSSSAFQKSASQNSAPGIDRPFAHFERISELACTTPGGPCYGENGEFGFATKSFGSLQRRTYWSQAGTDSFDKHTLEAEQGGIAMVDPYQDSSATGHLRFAAEREQTEAVALVHDQICSKSSNMIEGDFEFPSWDQLPAELQNPTTSAEYECALLATSMDVPLPQLEDTLNDTRKWDDAELNFSMDMDLDLDMDLNMMGKC